MKKLLVKIKNVGIRLLFAKKFLRAARFFHFQKLFPDEFTLSENSRCLLIAPHPDDETFGCGGLLAKYPDNFTVVCVSDGSKGGYNIEPSELAEIRKNEFESVMKNLNIKNYSFLNIPDSKIIKNYDIFKTIDINNYDYIFIANYFDEHKDHKSLTVLLQKMILESKTKIKSKIVFYEVWAALPLVSHFVDISDTIEKKIESINLYKSQIQYVDFLNGIIGLNKYRGILINRQYSECFAILDIKTFLKL